MFKRIFGWLDRHGAFETEASIIPGSTIQEIVEASRWFEVGKEYAFQLRRPLREEDVAYITFQIANRRENFSPVFFEQNGLQLTILILKD